MRNSIAPLILAAFLATPAQTQEDNRLEGWGGLLDGLRGEVDESLRDLRDWADAVGPALQSFIDEMGPALTEMMDEVQDWSRYETPEILPNGDIIIRRKPDDPEDPKDPDAPFPDGPDADPDAAPIDI